jgi:integrase
MARKKLTHKGIDRLTPPASGRIEQWDAECPGFGIRVTENGVKTFQTMYRVNGKLHRKALGRFVGDDVGCLAKARTQARAIIESARAGVDPDLAEREKKLAEQEERAERARARANTFAAVRRDFIELYARPKNKSWEAAARYLERDVSGWDERPIASITRRDVIAAVDLKAKEAPDAAKMLRAHLSKLFNWAIGRDLIEHSPVANVPRPKGGDERERVLTEVEVKRLWDAWADDGVGWPFGPMLRLLLATGQRRGEVAGMTWSEIRPRPLASAPSANETAIEWVWTIPAERTKGGRAHEVPLSPLAMEILGSLPRFTSGHVFPGRIRGHANGFSRAKDRSDELSGVGDWRIHDLRRTCGTGMAKAGIAVSTISRVLNHAEGGVTKIYNRYSFGPEKRHALETWARVLGSIVAPTAPDVADIAVAREKRRAKSEPAGR